MSFNAQFASLHGQFKAVKDVLTEQDKTLAEIRRQTTATNGRVTRLETSRKVQRAWVAGAAFVGGIVATVVGWATSVFFH